MELDVVVWGVLFFVCRMRGSVIMGEKVVWKLFELDLDDSGIYVLLVNMYGDVEMWDEVRKVRRMMKERGVEKIFGCSLIEVNGIVSEFKI